MSSTSARNWLFTVLTISVFSFALGISVGYALWFKDQDVDSPVTSTKVAEVPPAESPDEKPIEVANETDPPESRETGPESAVDEPGGIIKEQGPIEAALEDAPEPIHVARHLFISVNGQWLAQGTQQLISEIQPGGVVLQQRNIKNAAQTRSLVDEIKKYAGHSNSTVHDWPIIAISHEGGDRNTLRMDVAPDAATLASYQNDTTVEKLGQIYAREAYQRGIGIMLGPVFDLYDEGGFDPSFAQRAFGSEQTQVTSLGLAMAAGIRSEGMIPVIKHFPGYGSATYDDDGIQLTLNKEVSDLAKLLYPFNEAVRSGIEGIMVGHVAVPALDKDFPNRPAALSPVLVDELLRKRWGYKGVILADDVAQNDLIRMKSPSQAVVEALKAGCDAVLFLDPNPTQIREAVQAIQDAVDSGEIPRDSLLASQTRLEKWRTMLGAVAAPEPKKVEVVVKVEPPVLIADNPVSPPETETRTESDVEETPKTAEEETVPMTEPADTPEPPVEEKPTALAEEDSTPEETEMKETPTLVAKETVPPAEPAVESESQAEAETTPDAQPQEEKSIVEDNAPEPGGMSDEERLLMASAADAIHDALLKKEQLETPLETTEEIDGSSETDKEPIETQTAETDGTAPSVATEVETESATAPDEQNDEIEPAVMKTEEQSTPAPIEEKDNPAPDPVEVEEIISPEPRTEETPATPEAEEKRGAADGNDAEQDAGAETMEEAVVIAKEAKPSQITHTVKYNETLEQISRYYGVSKEDLVRWNSLDPPTARQGTVLNILLDEPAETPVLVAETPSTPTEAAIPSEIQIEGLEKVTHTVVAGDTLSAIASTHRVKMDDVITWNKMKNDQVQLGKKLILYVDPNYADPLPETNEIETIIHVVASGDTISNIARRYESTRDTILEINGITNPNHIQLGQKLKVPAPKEQ
jgi:beta-N-acetylhexosaminidase